MRDNFGRSFAATIQHEGGYVDHKDDPGGATNLGITIGTLSGWLGRDATKAEVRALTVDTVKPIYLKNYWQRLKCDDLPAGVDFAVYDFGVNSGVSRSAIFLQEIVGVAPDGKIGPLTLAAVDKWDSIALIETLCGKRMAFLKKLSTWPTFGKGWSSRVTGVLRLAKDIAIAFPAEAPATPKPISPTSASPRPKTVMDWLKGLFIKQATTSALNVIVKETKMSSNLFHNILNVAIAIVAILSLPEVVAVLPPEIGLALVGIVGVLKTVINIARDGFSGLFKEQPPVR